MNPGAAALAWNQAAISWRDAAVSGVLTVVVVGVLCTFIARNLSASLRCWLWWLLCARLTFAAASGLFGLSSLSIPVSLQIPGVVETQRIVLAGYHNGWGMKPNPDTPIGLPNQTSPVKTDGLPRDTPRLTAMGCLLLLWSVGVLVLLVVQGRASRQLQRLLESARDLTATELGGEMREMAARMGVSSPPRLVETPDVSTPFVTGLRRSILVLPVGFADSLSPDELRMALAHELAHLRRGDLYLALMPFAARILCFPIPVIPGWVCAAWATAREADCDMRAIQATRAVPADYSRLLIKIARGESAIRPTPLVTLGATNDFHTLQDRLKLIRASRRMRRSGPAGMLAFTLLATGATIPWCLTPTHAREGGALAGEKATSPHLAPLVSLPIPSSDVADVPATDTYAGGDPDKRYLLIGARSGVSPPPQGYRLLVVLPGGSGGVDFNTFVRRLQKRTLGPRYLIAELVAKEWGLQQFDTVVWPTQRNAWPTMRFSTESFVASVVADVEARFPVDRRQVFSLSWASGGPAGYAVSLSAATPIKGSFVAMSIFPTEALPSLSQARGRVYFLLHPENAAIIPPQIARRAENVLRQNGAKVKLVTYPGGYGWHGDVYAQVRSGIHYLEEQINP